MSSLTRSEWTTALHILHATMRRLRLGWEVLGCPGGGQPDSTSCDLIRRIRALRRRKLSIGMEQVGILSRLFVRTAGDARASEEFKEDEMGIAMSYEVYD